MAPPLPQILDLAAALLAAAVGAAHSGFGERLVFAPMRRGTWVPRLAPAPMPRSHLRILWASWHLATAFGLGIAAMLAWLALRPAADAAALAAIAAAAMALGSALVFGATAGRHPGWIGLLAVALLAAAAALSR